MDANIVIAIIGGACGFATAIVGNLISSGPKNREVKRGTAEWVVQESTKLYEDCTARVDYLKGRVGTLKKQNAELRRELRNKNRKG